ncbi:MAG: FecR domain-containing protein [Rhizobiales bacterium]|nr:FecR domain-containing protein [Hyphomicrobiales bacterium]MBN9010463.1 FecR domain-containing protein [Hyphomicrobiales bacterium]
MITTTAVGPATLARAAEETITVVIGSDQTIREVADKYLSDPDLWPEILKSSGIHSVADLHPGMELTIPVNEISSANKALIEALGQIQKANAAGAQIFAPDEIGRAVDLHEKALVQRLARQWTATKELALASFEEAVTALTKAEAQRDIAAEALVSDRAGNVEGQRPEDLSWRDLALRAVLIEEEKVRTLSDSTAQITFRDASRLRLNANSNAIIKEMRFDPLQKTQEAKVSLVEGDFYAVLNDDKDRTKFTVDIPQVSASIDSGDFWVSNGKGGAKFTNYDDKVVKVSAGGDQVILGRNEGTIVGKGAKPREAVAVLPAPAPLAPANEGPVFVTEPEIAWGPVDGAAGYWLEVAADQRFEKVVANGFGLDGTKDKVGPLPVGDYYWRVSALDQFGLPGARSPVHRFTVSPDDTPPFLKIDAPAEGAILRKAEVEVTGESEPGATLTVNGAAVPIGKDGTYGVALTAAEGANRLTLVATDPAGNKTTRERLFTYTPDEASLVAFDATVKAIAPLHFVTSSDTLSLAGRTTPNAAIEIRDGAAVRASAVADAGGIFHVNVPVAGEGGKLTFAVIAPSGFTTTEDFTATADRTPPEITLDEFLPQLTSETALHVAGRTEPGATLSINGRPVALRDGRFDEIVTLVAGDNLIELTATDVAGNVTLDKSSVKLDADPPKLVSTAMAIGANGGVPALTVEVVAEDASGLAKAAPVTVTAGDKTYTGYLRYNRPAKLYQGTLQVPADDIPFARLSRIELEDDAGNRKVFDIQ